jgi:hypothetical protein
MIDLAFPLLPLVLEGSFIGINREVVKMMARRFLTKLVVAQVRMSTLGRTFVI